MRVIMPWDHVLLLHVEMKRSLRASIFDELGTQTLLLSFLLSVVQVLYLKSNLWSSGINGVMFVSPIVPYM